VSAIKARRRTLWIGIEAAALALALIGLALGLASLKVSRAEMNQEPERDVGPQVTMFAVIATPDSNTTDARLARIKSQLEKLKPKHGFKLLDVQSQRIEAGQKIACDLKNGYRAETRLLRPVNENGKAELRCELLLDGTRVFSTLVKAPLNQLFFYERSLKDGSQLLIGIGAR
jgi:hypothetical protein